MSTRRQRPARLLLLLTVAGLPVVWLGCGTSAKQLPAQWAPAPRAASLGGAPRHIAVVAMENEEISSILGSRSTPFINSLARRYGIAQQMYGITHPSLPNYLALTGGSTFGITNDCTDCHVPGGGLAGQLRSAGLSWRAYMEDMPRPCFTEADSGSYAKKHNPFVYFDGVRGDPAACSQIVPYPRLAQDERGGTLPRFVWITPNLCHDMHDCDTATGDRFLAGMIPPLLQALGARGLLVLTFDEGASDNGCCRVARGGHVLTILAGGLARPAARLSTPVDHFSVLQTIEDLFGLPRLGAAACPCTPSLAPLVRGPRAVGLTTR